MTVESVAEPVLPFCDGRPKGLLIGGEWAPSSTGATFVTSNPSTGEALAEVAQGTADDVDRAVAAARRALEGPWARYTPAQRQDVILRLADLVAENYDELRLLDVHEMGSPIGGGRASLRDLARDVLRYYAGWATKIHGETIETSGPGEFLTYTRKEPVGVVGSIIPWNGPMIGALFKIAPVLASGCTMVLKPSEQACLSPLRLGELLAELDLPDGVVNIVTGDGSVGAAIVEHTDRKSVV